MAVEAKQVTAILLAAGRSERFGGDKLRAEIDGVAVGEHAAAALRSVGFGRLLVVVGPDPLDYSGFEPIRVAPGLPQGVSIAAGVAAAGSCAACLIALADMPFVPPSHFAALLAAHDGDITASIEDGRAMVPAIFDQRHFAALTRLDRDEGARAMLSGARLVRADPRTLADIDEQRDLPT